ncbi:MAG: hypothetical protein KC621_13360, partial [Myxococcales bacterium]|nr:hypothetical protein [Myxococcales bacterium]
GTGPAPAPPPREAVGMDSLVDDEGRNRAPRTFPHDDVSEDTPSFVDSTAGSLGVDGPIDIGDEDEPTVPGLVVPKEALESLAGMMSAESGGPSLYRVGTPTTEGNAAIEADISVDERSADVGGWDRDDWEEEDSILSEPPPPPPSQEPTPALAELASVPPPFPDMDADDDDGLEDSLEDLQAKPSAPPPPQQDVTADLLDLGARPSDPGIPPLEQTPPPLPDEDVFEDLTVDAAAANVDDGAPSSDPRAEEQPDGNRPAVDDGPAGTVVFTDDAEAQFELGRPLHLVLVGWTVNGEVSCGNHTDCELVLPENRIQPDQTFEARTYFRLKVRGRKGHLEVTAPSEVRVDDGAPAEAYDDPEAHLVDIVRRDDTGEEDFTVRIQVQQDRRLPDPRARLVALVNDDPLAAALVTRGIPKGAPRTIDIDGISLTFLFDGERITISEYLETYRRGDAFHPFFVQRGDSRYTTAPEDGTPFDLSVGDRLVVGYCVYELRAE